MDVPEEFTESRYLAGAKSVTTWLLLHSHRSGMGMGGTADRVKVVVGLLSRMK